MARNSLLCADVPLRNYSLTHSNKITITLPPAVKLHDSSSCGRFFNYAKIVVLVRHCIRMAQIVADCCIKYKRLVNKTYQLII